MLAEGCSQTGTRFQPIPRESGFLFSCNKHEHADGSYTISGLFDQDYIHNHKKLINHLYHSRVIMMGQNLVHSNYLAHVHDSFPFAEHGLTLEDVHRGDRQNWRSAQRVTFLSVQECLQQVQQGVHGNPPDPSVKGTLFYLKMVWHYVEIFCSGTASPSQRIRYAGLVVHFLAIWKNYIIETQGLSLQKNFLSRETFLNVTLSCHSAVMLICYMRDCFPRVKCRLDLTGTDVAETYFSANG